MSLLKRISLSTFVKVDIGNVNVCKFCKSSLSLINVNHMLNEASYCLVEAIYSE